MMKQTRLLLALLLGMSGTLFGQETDPNLPTQRSTKPVPNESGEVKVPEPAAPVIEEAPGPDDEVIIEELKGLIIVPQQGDINTDGVPDFAGLDVRGIPTLEGPGFAEEVVSKYLGQPLSINGIRKLERAIILYSRTQNRPLVDVIVPGQAVDNGVLQVWYLEGTVSSVVIENLGRRWVSDKIVRKAIRTKAGDPVDSKRLVEDVDWLNRNPFRQVDVLFRQSTNTASAGLGKSDIVLKVEDRLPVRGYVGYENSGTEVTGEDRLLIGVNLGSIFGLDHQFNYQYTTDTEFDLLKAHSASYQIPLPWRHTLTFFGSYVDAEADFGAASQIENVAVSYQASARYSFELADLGKYRQQVVVGVDFKDSDNDLEFGGSGTVIPSSTQILQAQASYSGVLPDEFGQTSMAVEAFYSPGGLTDKNESEQFEELRPGTEAEYFYGRLSLERITRLPRGFTAFVRGSLQLSSERLLPSEEFGLGGHRSVRGYPERLANGDHGIGVVTELRFPGYRVGNLTRVPDGQDYLQPLIFVDYGGVQIKDPQPGEEKTTELASAGVGLRYTISKNVSARGDIGYQLISRDLTDDNWRGHVGVVLSF